MHWNVALDALPGSATFVRVLDRWHNGCITRRAPQWTLLCMPFACIHKRHLVQKVGHLCFVSFDSHDLTSIG